MLHQRDFIMMKSGGYVQRYFKSKTFEITFLSKTCSFSRKESEPKNKIKHTVYIWAVSVLAF